MSLFSRNLSGNIWTPKRKSEKVPSNYSLLAKAVKISNKAVKAVSHGNLAKGGVLINKAVQVAATAGFSHELNALNPYKTSNADSHSIYSPALTPPRLFSSQMKTQNNNTISNTSGMGGYNDFGTHLGVSYGGNRNFLEILIESELLYYQDWQAQKIIDIPANDIMMKGFDFKGLEEDEIKKLRAEMDALDFYTLINQALRLERLHGGSVMLMGIASEIDNVEEPIDYDSIKEGDLTFLNVVTRYWVNRSVEGYDLTLPDYGRSEYVYLSGHLVHKSRLMIFNGSPLQYGRHSYFAGIGNMLFNDEFGYPLLGRMFQDLKASTASRQAALHLLQRASILKFTGDLQTGQAIDNSNSNETLQALMNNISNYNAALIHSVVQDTADIGILNANMSGVAEEQQEKLRAVCAASGIPLVKMVGESAKGLNASGDTELDIYYDMLRSYQQFHLGPQLRRFLPVLLKHCGISTPPEDVEIVFPDFESVNKEQEAAIRKSDAEVIVTLVNSGLISDNHALEELQSRDIILNKPEEFDDPVRDVMGLKDDMEQDDNSPPSDKTDSKEDTNTSSD